MLVLELKDNLLSVSWFKLAIFNTAYFKHADGGILFDTITRVVEIMEIDYLFNASLNNGFGAFDAREEMDVNAGALQILGVAAIVEDSIEFTVANIGIFSVIVVFCFADIPGH